MARLIAYPLCIEFVAGSGVEREPELVSRLPIVQNGPPGTFVVFADGARVSLPTDQIVFAEDSDGFARIGFGGMSFAGTEDGMLVFHRVRDLQPAELLSPQRGQRMTLEPDMVVSIEVDGARVWPPERARGVSFGAWLPLARAAAEAGDSSGLLQVRAEGLLSFPTGKSAMVLYAATAPDETLAAFVNGRGAPLLRRAAASGGRLVRFAATPLPEAERDRLLRQFVARFGAPPPANV